jgi:hypothetical protein
MRDWFDSVAGIPAAGPADAPEHPADKIAAPAITAAVKTEVVFTKKNSSEVRR